MILFDSLRRCKKPGSMFISALDLMCVQNGIMGNFCSKSCVRIVSENSIFFFFFNVIKLCVDLVKNKC